MNFYLKTILLLPILFLVSGCGVHKKSWLSNISVGMNKKQVKSKMGQPDFVHSSIKDTNGDIIDIWEYELATTNENQFTKRFAASFPLSMLSLGLTLTPGLQLLGLLTSPLAYIPLVCMDSPFEYDTYYLKFINEILSKWGTYLDVGLPKKQ